MGRRALIWLAAAVAIVMAFAAGFELHARSMNISTQPNRADARPLRAQVVAELRAHYFRSLPKAAMRAATVRGVITALQDPYTEYLDPAQYRDLVESQEGGYAGVGLALARGNRGLVVRALLPGLPAYRAGILPGDVITAVDERPVDDLPYREAVGLMHGAPGTPVRLLIVRHGRSRPLLLTLEREPVRVTRVRARTMGDAHHRVVYISVPAFVEGSASDVRVAVQHAVSRGAAGVVLDLRGNLGGLLSEAVATTRVFVQQGVVVTTGGARDRRQTLVADGSAVRQLPRLAVLIDGTTASAAEVVAGALQRDLPASRVVVVGSRSFGKGTVQAVHPLPNGGALKLTVAVFALAGGVQVDGRGVRPGVAAPDRPETDVDETLQAALAKLARS
jgi:carboxyl-terminal processing protease